MKLNQAKVLEILRRKNEGWTTYKISRRAGISVRRINQIWKVYLDTGKPPDVGKKVGRPPKPIRDSEVKLVRNAYEDSAKLSFLARNDFKKIFCRLNKMFK